MATIDLFKAVAVQDDQEIRNLLMSPQSSATCASSKYFDEYDGPGVERSFRLTFSEDQEITFFADTDAEKQEWYDPFSLLPAT
jgi:hypothetical protein